MRNSKDKALSTPLRVLASFCAGLICPALVLCAIALCFGVAPPLAIILETAPLSALIALLAVASWYFSGRDSTAARWTVSILIPVGIPFEACLLLNLIGGPNSRYDWLFILSNLVWALSATLATLLTAHWLGKTPVDTVK